MTPSTTPGERHIVIRNGQWVLTRPKSVHAQSVHERESDAVEAAAKALGMIGGTVRIHNADGTLKEAKIIPPAHGFQAFLAASRGGNHQSGDYIAAFDGESLVSFWLMDAGSAQLVGVQEAGRHLGPSYDDSVRVVDLEEMLDVFVHPYCVTYGHTGKSTPDEERTFDDRQQALEFIQQSYEIAMRPDYDEPFDRDAVNSWCTQQDPTRQHHRWTLINRTMDSTLDGGHLPTMPCSNRTQITQLSLV